MLDTVLNQLGLGEKEKIIYKLILEHGKIAPALLARLTKINRTTVYSVANELKSKGLIVEDLGGRTLYYLPSRENELEKLIKSEKEKAEQKEKSIHELQEFLKNIPESKTYSVPKIRFIDESEMESYFFEALPRWVDSMLATDSTWWGFQDHTLVERFEKWLDWSWEKSPQEIKLKLFTNKSDIEKKLSTKDYAHRRQLKYLDTNEFSASQIVCGSYLIFVVTKQRPFYLVEIHDSVIAHNVGELFKTMWNKA